MRRRLPSAGCRFACLLSIGIVSLFLGIPPARAALANVQWTLAGTDPNDAPGPYDIIAMYYGSDPTDPNTAWFRVTVTSAGNLLLSSYQLHITGLSGSLSASFRIGNNIYWSVPISSLPSGDTITYYFTTQISRNPGSPIVDRAPNSGVLTVSKQSIPELPGLTLALFLASVAAVACTSLIRKHHCIVTEHVA